MCDSHVDGPQFWHEEWRRARKQHTCYACRETIQPKYLYHYSAGSWDGHFQTFKHCARCWKVFRTLEDANDWGDAIDLGLNCGETYDGDDPEMLALAFASPDEVQSWAEEKR